MRTFTVAYTDIFIPLASCQPHPRRPTAACPAKCPAHHLRICQWRLFGQMTKLSDCLCGVRLYWLLKIWLWKSMKYLCQYDCRQCADGETLLVDTRKADITSSLSQRALEPMMYISYISSTSAASVLFTLPVGNTKCVAYESTSRQKRQVSFQMALLINQANESSNTHIVSALPRSLSPKHTDSDLDLPAHLPERPPTSHPSAFASSGLAEEPIDERAGLRHHVRQETLTICTVFGPSSWPRVHV